MPRKWYHAPVVQIKDLSPNTKSITLALDDKNDIEYKAGQFVTMDLPLGDKRAQRWRNYSISYADYGSRLLEFCRTINPELDKLRFPTLFQ